VDIGYVVIVWSSHPAAATGAEAITAVFFFHNPRAAPSLPRNLVSRRPLNELMNIWADNYAETREACPFTSAFDYLPPRSTSFSHNTLFNCSFQSKLKSVNFHQSHPPLPCSD
jgi:hypothetical protein